MVDSRVIILSANYGEGHSQVSNVLASQLRSVGLDKVKVIDLMGESHPLIDSISRKFYLKSYISMPQVYGWLYHSTKNFPIESKRAKWLHSFGIHKMKHLIEKEKPDLVIHTFPGSAASEIKRKANLSIPIFTVLTDFTLHQRWIHKQIDRYFVATESLKEEIVQAGESPEKVIVSGIPIRSSFEERSSTVTLMEKYQLDPSKKTILILAGAFGVSSDVKRVCESLKNHTEYQVMLICGKNKDLEDGMRQKYERCAHFKIFGFVDLIHELMQIATCVVSKPGGITVSEALAVALPMIFFQPVSGQEEENALFLKEKGAALIFNHKKNMGQQVLELVGDRERLSIMRKKCETLHVSHAAEHVTKAVLSYLNQSMSSPVRMKTY